MPSENFRDLIELDLIASRAMEKGKNGLSKTLRKLDETNSYETEIPEYFELFDVRKPADVYVDDKLAELIQKKFDARRRLEKGMSRRELFAFDEMLGKYLTKESLLPELKDAVRRDYHHLE